MLESMMTTIKREWEKMLRQKMIAIVIFIFPILVNFLIGFEFSKNQIQHIPMVVYDQDNSSFSRMIIQQFAENEIFDVRYYVENSLDLQKLLDSSKVRAGIVIPKDFGKDMAALKSPVILMLYDGSHMSIAAAAKSRASEILLTLQTGTFMQLIQAKLNVPADVAEKMALSIKFGNRTLYNPAKSFKNFLNTGFGTAIVQTGIALMTAVAVKRNEIEKEKIKRAGYWLGKWGFYSGAGMLSLAAAIWIQAEVFHIPFRGNAGDAVLLSFLLAASVTSFGLMISVWIPHEMLATQVNAVIFVPNTIMVGYTWPVLSMPRPYQEIARFFPFYHYADNLRDIFLKGLSLQWMQEDIQWFLLFIMIINGIALFRLMTLKIRETPVDAGVEDKEGDSIVFS